MKLLTHYNTKTHQFQICDERCYNASSFKSTCKCLCGGINHGVGLQQARQNINIAFQAKQLLGDFRKHQRRRIV